MRQIRKNVFETNSSSTHSFTVCSPYRQNSYLAVDAEGYALANMNGFCSCETYTSQEDKLGYILQLLGYTLNYSFNCDCSRLQTVLEEFYESAEFKAIEAEILDYVKETDPEAAHCIGIRFNDYSSYGYIDDGYDYDSLEDFLDFHSTTLIDFIFGNNMLHYEYNG